MKAFFFALLIMSATPFAKAAKSQDLFLLGGAWVHDTSGFRIVHGASLQLPGEVIELAQQPEQRGFLISQILDDTPNLRAQLGPCAMVLKAQICTQTSAQTGSVIFSRILPIRGLNKMVAVHSLTLVPTTQTTQPKGRAPAASTQEKFKEFLARIQQESKR